MAHWKKTPLFLLIAAAVLSGQAAHAALIRLDLQADSTLDVALTLEGAINGRDSATSQVSGYFAADIDFDAQGRPVGVRIVDADLNASDVDLAIPLGFPLGSLHVVARNLHLTAYTPDAPPNPPVDPLSGAFELDLHRFRLDGGSATAESVFYGGEFDFTAEPEEFTPPDGMTGTLVQPNGPSGGPVALAVPVAFREFVAAIDLGALGTVDVYVELDGTLMANGSYVPSHVVGDTNGDGAVDIVDLNNVRNNFGGSDGGDANGDGQVDIQDLNAVRNNFGSAAVVPEPRTLATLVVGLAAGSLFYLAGRGLRDRSAWRI